MGRKKASDILGELVKDIGKTMGKAIKPEDNVKDKTERSGINKETMTPGIKSNISEKK